MVFAGGLENGDHAAGRNHGIGYNLLFPTGADMSSALGVVFDWPTIGVVLTGIFASRGANFVSDLISKLQNIGADKTE